MSPILVECIYIYLYIYIHIFECDCQTQPIIIRGETSILSHIHTYGLGWWWHAVINICGPSQPERSIIWPCDVTWQITSIYHNRSASVCRRIAKAKADVSWFSIENKKKNPESGFLSAAHQRNFVAGIVVSLCASPNAIYMQCDIRKLTPSLNALAIY